MAVRVILGKLKCSPLGAFILSAQWVLSQYLAIFLGTQPGKRDISNSNTNLSVPRYSWILFIKFGDFDSRLRSYWVRATRNSFFKTHLKNNLVKFKIDPQPESHGFNLRLGGYSIWTAIFHRTLYLKAPFYLRASRLLDMEQPRKYSKGPI